MFFFLSSLSSFAEFSPEQEKAFDVLRATITHFSELCVERLPVELLPTDYKAFLTKAIYKEHLPHEDWWHWNQSNAKVERIYNSTKVVLQKFNTRKRNSSDP